MNRRLAHLPPSRNNLSSSTKRSLWNIETGLRRRGRVFRAKRLLQSNRYATCAISSLMAMPCASGEHWTSRHPLWKAWMDMRCPRSGVTGRRMRRRFLPRFEMGVQRPSGYSQACDRSSASGPPSLKAMDRLRFGAWRITSAATTNSIWRDCSGCLEKSTQSVLRVSSTGYSWTTALTRLRG